MASHHDYAGQDLEALADIPNYQDWILGHFRAHLRGRVLEVGAGVGTLSARYRDAARSLVLLEPASNLIDALAARFGDDPGVVVLGKPLGDAIAAGELSDRSFDAIVLVNVLEHVDDDVGMLHALHRLLVPGGALLLFVPALPWIFGSLDTLVGHRRRYVKAELRARVEAAGFAIDELRYFDALGVLPWYVTGRVLKARAFSERAARMYDTVGVPVGAWVEHRVAPPLGKNLLCIAHRSRA
ncbi:MAG TPA: methyltransferase domain-containing protein [Kofleriaceae bacterium]|nr:methyltransferase domain-containing protein [Kofleriaceae bacterium]